MTQTMALTPCHGTSAPASSPLLPPQLLRGQYFLARPILVPPRTLIVGAGMGLTGVYFREDTEASAPPAYITLNQNVTAAPLPSAAAAPGARPPSPTAWGLTDLAVFVSAFHNTVIDVPNVTDGFVLRRVRTRVNAFFGQNGLHVQTRGRWLNASSWEAMGTTLQARVGRGKMGRRGGRCWLLCARHPSSPPTAQRLQRRGDGLRAVRLLRRRVVAAWQLQ